VFNTGVDNSGALLSGGSLDPHYSLVVNAQGSGSNAYVVPGNAFPIAPFGPWIANGPNSNWLAPPFIPSTDNSNAVGAYTYQITFNLSGLNPSSATITGNWSTDDLGINILLNGVGTGITDTGVANCGYFSSFTISTGFVSGLNTLDFQVYNLPLASGIQWGNPTGLRVELSGTAAPIPLPSAIALLAPGLAGLAAVRRKFKK
jgi:hypothetical protein